MGKPEMPKTRKPAGVPLGSRGMRGSSHLLKFGLGRRLCLGAFVVVLIWLPLFAVLR
jgi:hypothetical protein